MRNHQSGHFIASPWNDPVWPGPGAIGDRGGGWREGGEEAKSIWVGVGGVVLRGEGHGGEGCPHVKIGSIQ